MNIRMSMVVLVCFAGSMSLPADAKRSEPRPVEPVLYQGVTYTAPHERADLKGYRPGHIQARDEMSNKLLWELQVYTVTYKAGLECDVQDVFITSLKIANNVLIVENERGEKFKVDLKTRSTEKLK